MGAAAAMGGSAAVGLVGAGMNSAAARRMAAQQTEGLNNALNINNQMYEQTRKDQQPWVTAGTGALQGMQDGDFQRDFTMGDFQADPGYAFRMAEGQKALERSAAAKGGLASGGTLKALTRYSQDMGAQEYQNAYNRFNSDRDRRFGRLSSIAGMGQHATDMLQSANQFNASNAGNIYTGIGNANAAGTAGHWGAWGNTLSGLSKAGMNYGAMQGMGGGGSYFNPLAQKNKYGVDGAGGTTAYSTDYLNMRD